LAEYRAFRMSNESRQTGQSAEVPKNIQPPQGARFTYRDLFATRSVEPCCVTQRLE